MDGQLAASLPGAEAPGGESALFALVVGNNRSLTLEQPDLHYADDDAVKYGQLFGALGSRERVHVLTRVDEATAQLFGNDLEPRGPPTREAMDVAVQVLRDQVAAARARGAFTTLYFVFAGHGQEDKGRGYLELEDQRFVRDDLVDLIQTVAPHRAHVLLDSCNSFFVIHPRRPGGRAWTSSTEIVDSLQVPGTDVGVFLSTSAEAQVYEWSQLQSGVFSHAVRSALLGAADADLDRRISYRELDAFVTTASSSIQNQLYRPHLYARSPQGSEVFIDLRSAADTFTLRDFNARITLRDQRGVRVADVNPEPGFAPQLVRLPGAELTVVAERMDDQGRTQLFEAALGQAEDLSPPLHLAAGTARGSPLLFAQIFRTPYGPAAVAAYVAASASPEPRVYGLTTQQVARFENQLRLMAEESRKRQITMAVIGILAGAGGASMASLPLLLLQNQVAEGVADPQRREQLQRDTEALSGVTASPFVGLSVLAAAQLFMRSSGEKIYDEYAASTPTTSEERAVRVAATAARLESQARANNDLRRTVAGVFGISGIVAGLMGGITLGVAGGVQPLGADPGNFQAIGTMLGVTGLLLCGAALTQWLNPSPEETFLDVMRRDPESVLREE